MMLKRSFLGDQKKKLSSDEGNTSIIADVMDTKKGSK